MRRTLILRREALMALTTDELAAVAGGAPAVTTGCPHTFYVLDCLSLPGCHVTA